MRTEGHGMNLQGWWESLRRPASIESDTARHRERLAKLLERESAVTQDRACALEMLRTTRYRIEREHTTAATLDDILDSVEIADVDMKAATHDD